MEALRSELEGNPPSSDPVDLSQLSRRELEVLSLLSDAHTAPEISRILQLSVHTVRNHVRSIYRKLAVHSRAALLRRLA